MLPVLIVSAVKEEVKYFIPTLSKKKKIRVGEGILYQGIFSNTSIALLITGMGKKNVQNQLTLYLNQYPATYIISIGVSGAIIEELQFADIIIQPIIYSITEPEQQNHISISTDFIQKAVSVLAEKNILFSQKNGLTVDRVIATPDEKAKLKLYPVSLIDMESYTVAIIAQKFDVPLISIRLILDTMNDRLPDFSLFTDDFAQLKFFALLKELVKKPTLLMELVQTAKRMMILKQKIKLVLKSLIEGFTN